MQAIPNNKKILTNNLMCTNLNKTQCKQRNVYELQELYKPHIFSGASSSNRIGCDRNNSLDLRHKPLISLSVS